MFPDDLRLPLGEAINRLFRWLVASWGDALERIADHVLVILLQVEWLFREAMPWWLTIGLVMAVAYAAGRRAALAAGVGLALLLVGALGLWDMAMQTVAIMIVAMLVSIAVGVPAGIVMARNDRIRAVALPVLDVMQTLPPFVYLVPVAMLIGLGKVPAIIATVTYAVPPLIRLTDLGLRMVDRDVVKASASLGAPPARTLWRVELPLALPNILAGVNQTTMMALSMVVIASMIGARGLGEQVLLGIQRLDIGQGFEAGIAIVAFAVVLDRITQAWGRRGAQWREPSASAG